MLTLMIITMILVVVLIYSFWQIADKNEELKALARTNENLSANYLREHHFAGGKIKYFEKLANKHAMERDELKYTENVSRRQVEEIKELTLRLKAANDEIGIRQKLKAIKFTANVPMTGWTKTEFKLGLGKCGHVVEFLKWSELEDRYVLTQWHEDGSRKEFEYMKSDIQGRIEKHMH